MNTQRTTTLAAVTIPLLLLSACSTDSGSSEQAHSTAVATVTTPAGSSEATAQPSPTTAEDTTAPAGTTSQQAGVNVRAAEDFEVADGIYTVVLDQGRGCNISPEDLSCGVTPTTINGRVSTGGMLSVIPTEKGFETSDVGGQPFLEGTILNPGEEVVINLTRFEHRADGTMAVTNGSHWFTESHGEYTSNLDNPASRGETVNAGTSCGAFHIGHDRFVGEVIAGVDGVNCATAMERMESYFNPQINNSPYMGGEGDITLRGGSKCTDKHEVNGATTQACTAADGSQLSYLKRS